MMKAIWLGCLFPFFRVPDADGQKRRVFGTINRLQDVGYLLVSVEMLPCIHRHGPSTVFFSMVNVHIDIQAVIGNKVQRWIVLVQCQ
jgi:hypothetical protein